MGQAGKHPRVFDFNSLNQDRLYHLEAHQLLIELDDRRMLFKDMAIELPSEVQESVFILRDKICSPKDPVRLALDSTLARTLARTLEGMSPILVRSRITIEPSASTERWAGTVCG